MNVNGITERFWAKVDKSGECWAWTGAAVGTGYGAIRVGMKTLKAHRVSWELAFGPIPAGPGAHGTCVCHRCDNRMCVRPSHLFLGTQLDNVRDCAAKDRFPRARMSIAEVRDVRARFAAGETTSEIATDYPFGRRHVRDIVTGRTWPHLPNP